MRQRPIPNTRLTSPISSFSTCRCLARAASSRPSVIIRQWDGSARIVVFSMRTGAMIAAKPSRRGERVCQQGEPTRELLAAVATVLRGERAMSADIARAIAQDEVAGGVRRSTTSATGTRNPEPDGCGMTAQAVAEALCLSLKTVHNNLSVIRATLGGAPMPISSGSRSGLGL